MSSGNVLVVDDSSVNRALLSEMLRRVGYETRAAENGAQALALIEDEIPDLVLLDIQMPGMTGFEVCRRIKQNAHTAEVPVVFISALDDVSEKLKGFEAGGIDYITKPFEPAEILARVGSQVNIHRLQRELRDRNNELRRRNEQLVLAQEQTERVFVALSDALPGTIIDDTYRLDTRIGEGGFGAVYRGTHLRLQRPVAVKILRPGGGADSERDLARFKLEGIAACRINHPNAVEVLDFGVSSGGIAYLVMELLRGKTVSQLLQTERVIPVIRCAEIIVPLCDALGAAHAAGIVHRDIKPHNVFLHVAAGREVVKVVDFGIAKLMDEPFDADLTKQGMLMGTPEYMAPERLFGHRYDERSDIYSIGVLLYRMLAGEMPYPRDDKRPSMHDMMNLHKNSSPRPLAELVRPSVPRPVVDITMQCLANDPTERPALAKLAGVLREAAASVRSGVGT